MFNEQLRRFSGFPSEQGGFLCDYKVQNSLENWGVICAFKLLGGMGRTSLTWRPYSLYGTDLSNTASVYHGTNPKNGKFSLCIGLGSWEGSILGCCRLLIVISFCGGIGSSVGK